MSHPPIASTPQMILVAGPYRSGTGDDPAKIAANVRAMTDAALQLYRAGHLPVLGEWFASATGRARRLARYRRRSVQPDLPSECAAAAGQVRRLPAHRRTVAGCRRNGGRSAGTREAGVLRPRGSPASGRRRPRGSPRQLPLRGRACGGRGAGGHRGPRVQLLDVRADRLPAPDRAGAALPADSGRGSSSPPIRSIPAWPSTPSARCAA